MGKGEVSPESRVQEVAPPVNTSVFSGVVGQYPRQNYACKKIQYEKLFWQFHKSFFSILYTGYPCSGHVGTYIFYY